MTQPRAPKTIQKQCYTDTSAPGMCIISLGTKGTEQKHRQACAAFVSAVYLPDKPVTHALHTVVMCLCMGGRRPPVRGLHAGDGLG